MDYKKEIIEMIEKMESIRFLAMIYSFAHTLFEKEKKQGEYLKVRRFRTMFEYKEPKDGR